MCLCVQIMDLHVFTHFMQIYDFPTVNPVLIVLFYGFKAFTCRLLFFSIFGRESLNLHDNQERARLYGGSANMLFLGVISMYDEL